MDAVTITADAAFPGSVDVKVMQVLVTVPKLGRFTGQVIGEGALIMTIKTEGKVPALIVRSI